MLFRLAGHLKMTVGELERRMSSREFAEWVAYTRYFEAIPDPWKQTGLQLSAMLAPHCERGKVPKPDTWVPLDKAPQHSQQINDELDKLLKLVGD